MRLDHRIHSILHSKQGYPVEPFRESVIMALTAAQLGMLYKRARVPRAATAAAAAAASAWQARMAAIAVADTSTLVATAEQFEGDALLNGGLHLRRITFSLLGIY